MTISFGDLWDLFASLGAGTLVVSSVAVASWGWMMLRERNYWREVALTLLSANERNATALEQVVRRADKHEVR